MSIPEGCQELPIGNNNRSLTELDYLFVFQILKALGGLPLYRNLFGLQNINYLIKCKPRYQR